MATVKMAYVIQSCPHCNKELLKVAVGTKIIGSPLLTCKGCGHTYRTELRTEWYDYSPKWMLWGMPLILFVIGLVVGLCMGEPAIGLIAAFFALIIGLCITGRDVVRMIKSKKRMRNANYLAQLLLYGVTTKEQYENFMQKAA